MIDPFTLTIGYVLEHKVDSIQKGQEEDRQLMKTFFKKVLAAIKSANPNENTSGVTAVAYHTSVMERDFSNLPCNTVDNVIALNTALSDNNLSISMVHTSRI